MNYLRYSALLLIGLVCGVLLVLLGHCMLQTQLFDDKAIRISSWNGLGKLSEDCVSLLSGGEERPFVYGKTTLDEWSKIPQSILVLAPKKITFGEDAVFVYVEQEFFRRLYLRCDKSGVIYLIGGSPTPKQIYPKKSEFDHVVK